MCRRVNDPVTVVVSRFDPVVACGLATILGRDHGVRLLAEDLELVALERVVARDAPRVAILDETAVQSLLGRFPSISPATAIVVFAHDPPPAYGKLLLAAGATCVGRSISPIDLVATVHRAARGDRTFAPANGERLERCCPRDAGLLTQREREVFVCLSKDQSYSTIACELQIGIRTVESYASRVREKLRVRDKQELVGMPIPRGWSTIE
jgi:DNA-binding NarL/FixJ family response regulator